MANVKDDQPEMDQPNDVLGEELSDDVFATEADLASFDEAMVAEPVAETEAVTETEALAEVASTTSEESLPELETVEAVAPVNSEEEIWQEPSKLPFYFEVALLIGIPLILGGIAFAGLLDTGFAVLLVCLGVISYVLWKSRSTNTIFTILLGIALSAILIAIYFFYYEIVKQYHGELNPKGKIQVPQSTMIGPTHIHEVRLS